MSKPNRYAIVVDDHPLVAHGIAAFLTSDGQFDAVHTCHDADACLNLLALHGSSAFVVLDFWLVTQSAPELIKKIRCTQKRASSAF